MIEDAIKFIILGLVVGMIINHITYIIESKKYPKTFNDNAIDLE